MQDCIGAGLPSVASQDLANNLAAPGYINRVSDKLDPAEIATALATQLGANLNTEPERLAYCETHSMPRYAKSLLEVLGLG